jgi:hypothetical protein
MRVLKLVEEPTTRAAAPVPTRKRSKRSASVRRA